jgi:hypothetical protein
VLVRHNELPAPLGSGFGRIDVCYQFLFSFHADNGDVEPRDDDDVRQAQG